MKKIYLTSLLVLLFSFFATGLNKLSAQSRGEFVMEEPVLETKITMVDGGRLLIENLPKDEVLEIYSIVGVKVFSQKIKSGTNEYTLNLPKGYYIIRIGKIVKKFAIR